MSESITQRNGGSIFILCQDVESAFPGLWQAAASWSLRYRGVKGKLWRLSVMLDSNLRSVVRVNGHFSSSFDHGDGASQGSVSAGKRFNSMHALAWEDFKSCSDGFLLASGMRLHAVGFVDDVDSVFGASGGTDVCRWLSKREVVADKWRYKWKYAKDQLLVRGLLAGNTFSFPRNDLSPLLNSDNIEVLGYVLTSVVGFSPPQLSSTIQRMHKKVSTLMWLAAPDCVPTMGILHHTYESTVVSVVNARLLHLDITPAKRACLDAPFARLLRYYLGVSYTASKLPLLADVGVMSVFSKLVKGQFLLLGRLARVTADLDPVVASTAAERASQVADGNRQGLDGMCAALCDEFKPPFAGLLNYRGAKKCSKHAWKKLCQRFLLSFSMYNGNSGVQMPATKILPLTGSR